MTLADVQRLAGGTTSTLFSDSQIDGIVANRPDSRPSASGLAASRLFRTAVLPSHFSDATYRQFRSQREVAELRAQYPKLVLPAEPAYDAPVALGLSTLPGGGELVDAWTLFSPASTDWDRSMAHASLGLSILTVGLSPNYGAVKGLFRRSDAALDAPSGMYHTADAAQALDPRSAERGAQAAPVIETVAVSFAPTAIAGRAAGATRSLGSAWVDDALRLSDDAARGPARPLFSDHVWGRPDRIPCFPAEALVHTPHGVREIHTLCEGDEVLAYDSSTRTVVSRRITACLKNWTTLLVKLLVRGETIWATRIHPFYLPDLDQWMPACDLRAGMRLLDKDLQPQRIEHVEHMAAHEDTYNITVEEFHTYFVGEVGVLVHNDSFTSATRQATEIYLVRDAAGNPAYVGKTVQGVDLRFRQQIATAHPEWARGFRAESVKAGRWTSYEAAVWEQHFMDVYGGKAVLQNQRNAIAESTYQRLKLQFDPC